MAANSRSICFLCSELSSDLTIKRRAGSAQSMKQHYLERDHAFHSGIIVAVFKIPSQY